jgi:hypothetical protein
VGGCSVHGMEYVVGSGVVKSGERPQGHCIAGKQDKQDKNDQQQEDNDILQGLYNPSGTPGTPLGPNPLL